MGAGEDGWGGGGGGSSLFEPFVRGGSSLFEPFVRGGSFNFQLPLRGGSSYFFSKQLKQVTHSNTNPRSGMRTAISSGQWKPWTAVSALLNRPHQHGKADGQK